MIPKRRREKSSVSRRCLQAMAVVTMAMATGFVHAQPASGNEVVLTPGTCPTVQNGDIAVLEWNPAFDSALSLTDVENLRLRFTAPVEQRTSRAGSVLELRLRPQRSSTPVETPLEDIHNGYYRMRFRIHAPLLASGEYHLASAAVEPKIAADGSSVPAVMRNDPSHSAFCVTFVSTAKKEMKGKMGRSN